MEKKRSSYEEEKKPSVFDRFAEELKGEDGKDGLSAYDLACEQGFSGSLVEWLDSLKSREPGLRGLPGDDGKPGKDVYEVAVAEGFTGTRRQFLESLNGTNGLSAYELACECGFTGSMNEWLDSLCGKDGEDGKDGLSAYEIAKNEGFTGTVAKWLLSLKGLPGEDGEDGLSAYEVAVKNGFKGSIDKWLESLKGEKGDSFDVTSIRWNNIGNKPSTFEPNRATVRSIIGNSLIGGTNITVTYDPNTGLTTIDGSGGGITDGDKGDITVSGGGTTWTIDAGVVDTTELSAGVNSSLGLANSALQSGDNVSELTNDAGYTTNTGTVTSVAVSGSDGLEIDSGSPITTNGTIALGVNKTNMLTHLNVEDGADVTDATNVGAAGAFMKATDDITDITGSNRRVFYTDGTGAIIELALGANGTFLQSNGTTSAPSFAVPAGSGDVSKVGTPVDNQIGVWTGDGTIEGDADLTFDTTTNTLSTVNIAVSGTVDGRDVATDGSKLDGIEAGAEVNDVNTVNGQAGTVVLDADDIDDTSTSHKFVTATDLTTLSNTSGTNTGDQTITLTGDVTGTGTGSFATTIANDAVTYAKMQNVVANNVILGNNSGAGGVVDELTASEVRTIINVEDGAEVNNISDANATDLTDGGDTTLHTHDGRYYTESEVDIFLGGKIDASEKGANNGVAELDAGGKVPSSQLPSYVDDVVMVANFAALPGTGETDKIYVTEDTNLTYRWNGSGYTEISPSLALGETSSTAYRGDRGKTAYDHSQLTSGNPHNVTKTDVGLSNVVNADTTTTANITDSSNKRFVTDAQQTVIGNTSGTNTGDQNLFSTIAVSGQSDVVADSTSDTLTLVAGTNITITTDAGTDSITINASGGGGGGITWNEVTGTSQTASVNNGYITNNAGVVTVTLPATAAIGDTVRVAGKGAGLREVAQNSGQTIHFGVIDSTTGVTGGLEATERYDSVELVCITANTDWVVVSSLGNIDVI